MPPSFVASTERAAAPPAVLLVLPWSPDAIGGVSEAVITLHRGLATGTPFRPCILVDAYPQRRFATAESPAIGTFDLFHVPALPVAGKGLRHLVAFAARMPAALARLVAYLRRENIRAINVHYPTLGLATLLLARFLAGRSIPVVVSFHGADLGPIRAAGAQRRIWKAVLARCDAVVACSRALAEEIERCCPHVGARLHVVHNGIDGEACRAAVRFGRLPSELASRRYIACIATFEDKKGQDVLLEAFRDVARRFQDVHLVLVGRTGPNLESLRAAAQDKIQGRVHLLPDRDHADALAIMAAAELMVLPSRQEPFGIVLLEAASLGVPVVASRVGGIPEIVEHGRSGILVKPDEPHALADAICRLLARPELGRSYAAGLRQDAESRFTAQRTAEGYVALFAPVSRARTMPRSGAVPRSAR